MQANKALVLVAAALIAIGAYYVTREKAPSTAVENALLYPGLLDRLNDSRSIEIKDAGDAFTLKRDAGQWTLVERDGYPVRGEMAKAVLVQLADLRIRERKTSKPENYAELGVTDEAAAGSETRRVIVRGEGDGALADLIVGKARQAKGLESPGHYVRKAGEPTAWLVEGEFTLATKRNDWMDTQVLDLPVERVRRVTITHPQQQPVVVTKADPKQQLFTLHDAPEGYEARSSAVISSIGGLLLDVRFDDVAAAGRIDGLVPRTIVEVQTFDGLVATLEQYDVKGENFVKFDFAFNSDLVHAAPEAPAATPPEEASPASPATAPAPTVKPASEVQAEIETLKKKTAPWVYALADYKVRIIDKKMEDLIKTKAPPTPTPEPIERMGKEAP
ncbi:MAG: DUF4340 domain-containing protein [Gammaproteobacteria bacterium]